MAEIKEEYDLPTEEVAKTVSTENNNRFRNIFKKMLDSQAINSYTLIMLRTTETECKLHSPLVTNMGFSYSYIVSSMAAKILAHETAEAAAQSMYDLIEDGIKSGAATSETGKKFWEDVIAEMVTLNEEFATAVSATYFKLVLKNYLPSKP